MLAVEVAAAAGFGAFARYLIDRAIQQRHTSLFPWGTLTINVTGCFLLGVVTGLQLHHGLSHNALAILGTGALGGYTTWSTFMWESFALTEQGAIGAAATNVAGSIAVGLSVAAAGLGLALI
jgi:CrcB protein